MPAQSSVSASPATSAAPLVEHPTRRRRAALGYLALAVPGFLVIGDALVAALRGWRPDSRLDQLTIALATAWLAIATLPLATVRGRRGYAAWCPQFVLLAVTVAVVWLAAEAVLGPVLATIEGPFHGRKPGTEIEYRPIQSIMPGVSGVARVRFNSLGVRGSDPPARDKAYRILCLGGSSTACTYLDDAKTWPTLLAENLQKADPQQAFWVGNAGIPGFRGEQHLQFVEQSPIVNQVDCVIVQAGINDFMACLAGSKSAPPCWTRSRIWKLARAVARPSNRGGTQVEDESGRVYERRRAMRATAEISEEPPQLEACLRAYSGQIEQMIDACQQRHVRLVFTTQATLWRDGLDKDDAALLWFGQLADGRFLSTRQLRAGMDRYNAVLKEVCERRGVELIDLSVLDGQSGVFYDDCHYTEVGTARVAALIADGLAAHPVGGKAGSP